MKDISTLVNRMDLAKKDDHSLQNKVPPIVKTIVDSLFDQLAFVFPAWKYTWDSEEKIKGAKKEWVKAFFENDITTKEQISYGLKKARAEGSDFLPSCGKFVQWCSPTPEDLGYPSEAKALKQCISHRNNEKMFTPLNLNTSHFIMELCKRVDWWEMNNATNQQQVKKSEVNFNEQYLELISVYVKPEESSNERLETTEIVRDRMSDKQIEDGRKRGLELLKEVKRKMKHKQ